MFAPIPWMGGKSRMRKNLYAIFDRIQRDAMLDRLINLQASAVVSCYDNEAYRRLEAAGYAKEQFQTVMSVNKGTDAAPRTETVYWRWSGWKNRRLF